MSLNNPAAAGAKIATGSYTGDGTYMRQIVTGFKCSAVLCWKAGTETGSICIPGSLAYSGWKSKLASAYNEISYQGLHATDGFIADAAGVPEQGMNTNSQVYYYWAIGESS